MQRTSRQIIYTIINVLLILAIFTFIFGNSLLDRAASSERSLGVLAVLSDFINGIVGHSELTEHFVRKLAHFCEFAALGFFTLQLCAIWRHVHLHYILHSLFLGLLCAVTDEAIQLLSDRNSQVIDVLLDFSGVIFGCVFFLLLYELYCGWKQHIANKSSTRLP